MDANEGRRITNAMILSFINANGGSKFMKARQGLKACRAAINQYLSEKVCVCVCVKHLHLAYVVIALVGKALSLTVLAAFAIHHLGFVSLLANLC